MQAIFTAILLGQWLYFSTFFMKWLTHSEVLYSTRSHGTSPTSNCCLLFLGQRVFRQKSNLPGYVPSAHLFQTLHGNKIPTIISSPSTMCLSAIVRRKYTRPILTKSSQLAPFSRKIRIVVNAPTLPLQETSQDIFYQS